MAGARTPKAAGVRARTQGAPGALVGRGTAMAPGPCGEPAPSGSCSVGQRLSLPPPVRISVARPASSRAIGTRNGEQDT